MNALNTQAEQYSGAAQTWLAVSKGVGKREGLGGVSGHRSHAVNSFPPITCEAVMSHS